MIQSILDKVLEGERLTFQDGIALFQTPDLTRLGQAAEVMMRRKHPEGVITYAIDRNINYTNICYVDCDFCAFYRHKKDDDAYLLSKGELKQKIDELKAQGGTHTLFQGGHHPNLKLDFYEDMLRWIKQNCPIHMHAFSPPEIHHFARINKMSIREVIGRLRDAGLDSIPGGGAEILTDHSRQAISPKKCSADEWLDVMRQAHELGLRTTATMMYGHVESYDERVEHLVRLRELQDETGGFTAFICWSLQPNHTRLEHIPPTGGFEYLKTLAIARLMLDNFDNLQASWVTQGPKIGQMSLKFGANDMGGTMIEENVVSRAGTTYCMPQKEMFHVIQELGYTPVQRDFFYEPVKACGKT